MRTIERSTPISAVLANDGAAAAIRSIAPEVLDSPMVVELPEFPSAAILGLILGEDDPRISQIMKAVSGFEDLSPRPAVEPAVVPAADYESGAVPLGSARVDIRPGATANRRTEIVLHGPSHGNPFVDVDLTVTFGAGGNAVAVGAFYDGDGTYRARFLPPSAGEWSYTTASNARSLDGIRGTISVSASHARGPIRAVEGGRFAYADGTPYVPVGTTAYAWTHQEEALQEQTLGSLADAPFNKIRMGLFPKSFLFNANEPERFVFPRAGNGWDTTRFDLEYFAALEMRLDQLAARSIEADLILFHPYDRWGFATLGPTVDDRYVAYVTRRLAAFSNVWWSLANEYDLLTTKKDEDWDRLARVVRTNDPYGHPLSIHNWVQIFDYSADWATHCSIQRGDYAIGKSIARWKRTWGKPVIVDEAGYEGDIDQGWGNLPAEEMVRRFWDATMYGGYLTHGETYYSEDDVLWWSKGGALQGDSPPRLAFLRQIIDASPTGRIEPLPSDWDFPSGGADGYIVTYFGGHRPRYRDLRVPPGMRATIEVIDTWEMRIEPMAGIHTGRVRVDLPARPYTALRVILSPDS